jgi:hypothetical protein
MDIYGRANRNVGGAATFGNDAYNVKAAGKDRTILHDALVYAVDEAADVLREIQTVMDSPPPTTALPGSREKVDAMERRANAGYSIFVDSDPRD